MLPHIPPLSLIHSPISSYPFTPTITLLLPLYPTLIIYPLVLPHYSSHIAPLYNRSSNISWMPLSPSHSCSTLTLSLLYTTTLPSALPLHYHYTTPLHYHYTTPLHYHYTTLPLPLLYPLPYTPLLH